MDTLFEIAGLILAVLLRIGIPIGVTVLLAVWLQRRDARWKAEMVGRRTSAGEPMVLSLRSPCWELIECSIQEREACPAYADQKTPCWQLFRDGRGQLMHSCLSCQVFLKAPLPFVVHDTGVPVPLEEPAVNTVNVHADNK